jgi:hypothetical protein
MRPYLPPVEPQWFDKLSDLCSLGELIELKIGHEVSLMGHRMEWLVVSEAFLFGAFVNVATCNNAVMHAIFKSVLLYMFPILGIVLAGLAAMSVRAAIAVASQLREARAVVDEHVRRVTKMDQFPNLGNSSRSHGLGWTEAWGAVSAKWVPAALALAWTVALGFVVYAPAGVLVSPSQTLQPVPVVVVQFPDLPTTPKPVSPAPPSPPRSSSPHLRGKGSRPGRRP